MKFDLRQQKEVLERHKTFFSCRNEEQIASSTVSLINFFLFLFALSWKTKGYDNDLKVAESSDKWAGYSKQSWAPLAQVRAMER
jgi:hypothetical protein